MSTSGSPSSRKQEIIHLDVGGTPFKILKSTVQRYPNSLLGRMLVDFPNLGEPEEPLFIDRSPKAFPWILEIYRDGDHKRCVPDMSPGFLPRELEFYQLPLDAARYVESIAEKSLPPTPPELDSAAFSVTDLAQEIKDWGLQGIYPLDVFLYYQFREGSDRKARKFYLRPSLIRRHELPCNFTERLEFKNILAGKRPKYLRERDGEFIRVHQAPAFTGSESVDVVDDTITLVKSWSEAERWALDRFMRTFGLNVAVRREELSSFGKSLQFQHLVVGRQS